MSTPETAALQLNALHAPGPHHGHGDEEFLAELSATVAPDRVVLAGTHS